MKYFSEDVREYLFSLRSKLRTYVKELSTGSNRMGIRLLVRGTLGHFVMGGQGYDQRKLIFESDWDMLIILDGCRYDYFEKEYKKFLDGKLIKACSPASNTPEWLKRTFSGYYPEIEIISANPILNSSGVEIFGYKATNHFPSKNIHDIWDWGWTKDVSSIHPENVVRETLRMKDSSKLLVWFMQPHGPYIGNPKIVGKVFKEINMAVRDGRVAPEKLKDAYRGNLRLVLEYISKLTEQMNARKIVVTSDHGELLGEYGSFFHFYGMDVPELKEVPYLVLEGRSIDGDTA